MTQHMMTLAELQQMGACEEARNWFAANYYEAAPATTVLLASLEQNSSWASFYFNSNDALKPRINKVLGLRVRRELRAMRRYLTPGQLKAIGKDRLTRIFTGKMLPNGDDQWIEHTGITSRTPSAAKYAALAITYGAQAFTKDRLTDFDEFTYGLIYARRARLARRGTRTQTNRATYKSLLTDVIPEITGKVTTKARKNNVVSIKAKKAAA